MGSTRLPDDPCCVSAATDGRKNGLRGVLQHFFRITKPEAMKTCPTFINAYSNALNRTVGLFIWCVRPRRGVGVARFRVLKAEIVFWSFCRASFVLFRAFPAGRNRFAVFLETRAWTSEALAPEKETRFSDFG